MDIATTGELRRLIIKGTATNETLIECFENIVKRNSDVSGNFQYLTYFQLLKSYAQYIAEYTVVKALLIKLTFVIHFESITEVRKRGYKISTENSKAYAESLIAGLHRVSNLITRATMKRKEIEKAQVNEETTPQTFESILANLCYNLGFTVPDSITLAGYNEYKRIIKAKIDAQTRQQAVM